MTTLIGPPAETLASSVPLPEHSMPSLPSLPRAIGRFAARLAGRAALPVAGTMLGAYVALNGAHYEASIDGTQVAITSDVGFEQRGIYTDIELSDDARGTMSLGGVDFPESMSWLPLSVHATAFTGAEEVEKTLLDRYSYLDQIKEDAEKSIHDAAFFFIRRTAIDAGTGLITGVALTELAAWRRRNALTNKFDANGDRHPFIASLGRSGLALMLVTGGGIMGAASTHSNFSYHEGHGVIGDALKSPDGLSGIHLHSPVLDKILQDFQHDHACPETPVSTEEPPDSLMVTTYNIKRGQFSDDGIEGIVRELARTNSDVIFLQEVTPAALNTLAAELDMQAVPGWTINNADLTYGNALLTRLPVAYSEFIPLPSDGVEPRGALAVEVASPENGEPFLAVDTHLTQEELKMSGDANAAIRKKQAEALVRRLRVIQRGDETIILAGDDNERVHGPAYDVLTEYFQDMVAGSLHDAATFPQNGLRFDNILLQGSGWKTLHANRGGGNNSDHCLVQVSLGMAERYVTAVDTLSVADPIPASPSVRTN
jgi:endonuclease/exonuclease/phosphatase family metal-dependent hydrolase